MSDIVERLRGMYSKWSLSSCGPVILVEDADEITALRAALVEERKRALEDGFIRGFMSSAEGYNGEYPFDLDEDCLSDPKWVEMRERVLRSLMEKPE